MPQKIEARCVIRVEIEALWRTFAKDFTVSWAKVLPDIVTSVTILEGDGGLGTLLFLQFKPGKFQKHDKNTLLSSILQKKKNSTFDANMRAGGPTVPFQKTKIVEFDNAKHQLALEVLEGGHLSNGFTKYVTYFKLTGEGERETLVDITVVCEPASEEEDLQAKTTRFPLLFFKSLEAYLHKVDM